MAHVSRAQWGARRARSTTRLNATKPSTGHWVGPTVTVAGRKTWDHSKCAGIVRGIQNFHMDGRGWQDIAYSYLVCPHGDFFEGRGLNVRTAANGTNVGNASSHAICFIAGEGNDFTEAEKRGFVDARNHIDRHTSAPGGAMCHSDHKSTECPGHARRQWIKAGAHVQNGSTPAPVGRRLLREGLVGDDVLWHQACLNIVQKRYPDRWSRIEEDKHYGSRTAWATLAFKLMHNEFLAAFSPKSPRLDHRNGAATVATQDALTWHVRAMG